ncbi:FliG C-terminal domain-containing protein [Aureimonas sp. ME7]|uniref:FliG C-terminal domain-containing protein n=1 Tax=Aureimonas sp. ME7 TaxID=2744252 RepID=UPI0015F43A2D|nr:FliG C-terminal domain-containing protein [Aureimonas sp. ME7]
MMLGAYQPLELEGPPKSGASRAAILLLTLGGEGAAKLLKHFSPEEIRALRQSATLQQPVTTSELEEIVAEFQDAFRTGPAMAGLEGELNKLLRNTLSTDELAIVFEGENLLGTDSGVPVWQEIEQMGAEAVAKLLEREHPQVVAYTLQRLRAEVAATVVAGMPTPKRNDIVRRMLSAAPPSEAVAKMIELRFREAFVAGSNGAERKARHATLADIVNRMEKAQSDEVLASIEASEPDEAVALRKLLFAYEDILSLPKKARLILFDAIPAETVTQSLTGANDDLREAVLSALGARTRRMVEAELSRGEAPAADVVTTAKRSIASAALRLSAEGRIDLTQKADA